MNNRNTGWRDAREHMNNGNMGRRDAREHMNMGTQAGEITQQFVPLLLVQRPDISSQHSHGS